MRCVLCIMISAVEKRNAAMAQVVEHVLGKDEVTSSNLVSSSKKSRSSERDFFIHCESNGMLSRVSVYVINDSAAIVVSHHNFRCVSKNFRNDDIQNFALMICNSCGIDDIQCFAWIYFDFSV